MSKSIDEGPLANRIKQIDVDVNEYSGINGAQA